jgi:hypothetical protein
MKYFQEQKLLGKVNKEVEDIETISFNSYLKGAERSIQLYLLLNNPSLSNKGIADENGLADLVEMLKDPIKMFGDIKDIELSETTVKNINAIKNADKLFKTVQTETAKDFKTLVARERKQENTFIKQAKKLFKDFGKDNDQYKDLKINETNRLKNLYENNIIPKDYYEKRIELIEKDVFDKKAPFCDDGILSKKDYIESTGLEALTKDEINGLYESYKLKIEHEKQIFLNSKYLTNNKYIPDPQNVSTEPLHNQQKQQIQQIQKVSINLNNPIEVNNETKIKDVENKKTVEKIEDLNKK